METHDEAALAIHDMLNAAKVLERMDRRNLRFHEDALCEAHERLTLIVQSIQSRHAA